MLCSDTPSSLTCIMFSSKLYPKSQTKNIRQCTWYFLRKFSTRFPTNFHSQYVRKTLSVIFVTIFLEIILNLYDGILGLLFCATQTHKGINFLRKLRYMCESDGKHLPGIWWELVLLRSVGTG